MNGLNNVLRELVSKLPGTWEPAGLFMRERLDSTTTCSASYRGAKRRSEGGAGVADTLQVCRKTAADSYSWGTVATTADIPGVTTAFSDADFAVYDNGDNTKIVALQVSGVSASTTRTLTVPNESGTIFLGVKVGTASATWNPGLIAAGAQASTTITVTGAAVGDYVSCSHTGTIANANVWFMAPRVEATDTVRVAWRNFAAGNQTPSSGTLACTVWRP